MRALKEIPKLKPMIASGSLSVSTVSKVQTHLKQEAKAGIPLEVNAKIALFEKMQNCTSREVDVKLAEVRGKPLKEKLLIELDEELRSLWLKVKGLAAHRSGGDSAEVLRILTKTWLAKNDPARSPVRKSIRAPADKLALNSQFFLPSQRAVPLSKKFSGKIIVKSEVNPLPVLKLDTPPKITRYIPLNLRRNIWRRDQAKCTRCGSAYALEVDHLQPFALGGDNKFENLRLLCRSCNQFQAVKDFDLEKITGYRR